MGDRKPDEQGRAPGQRMVEALTGDAAGRALVFHIDDVGMCHGANVAFLELMRAGNVTCGSIMVPCPWFREIAAEAAHDKALDLGVHLTLTSEWPLYRWGPISTTLRESGLIDEQGCFPRNCLELRPRVNAQAAEVEFRAQIDRALDAGIDVTHIDTHMGAAVLPELVDVYIALGHEYDLPILLPRELNSYTGVLKMGEVSPGIYEERVAALDAAGMPVFDRFRMTPFKPDAEPEPTYRAMIEALPSGVTYFGLHCNAPGDIEMIVPPRAHFRTEEYALFASGAPARWARDAGIKLIGMREVRALWRTASQSIN
ncbi:MAG: polysaccharide deacetylase family protein [Casimicrobiaceae bacterium]